MNDHINLAIYNNLQLQCFTLGGDIIVNVKRDITYIKIYEFMVVRVNQAMFGPTFTSPKDKMHGGNNKEPLPLPRMIKHTKGKYYKDTATISIITMVKLNTVLYKLVKDDNIILLCCL